MITELKEYMGVKIYVTEAGKFFAKIDQGDGRRVEVTLANIRDVEKRIAKYAAPGKVAMNDRGQLFQFIEKVRTTYGTEIRDKRGDLHHPKGFYKYDPALAKEIQEFDAETRRLREERDKAREELLGRRERFDFDTAETWTEEMGETTPKESR